MSSQPQQRGVKRILIDHIKEQGPLCPHCRYSLKGLAGTHICPECGSEIDIDRIATEYVNAAAKTATTWCGLGAIGWIMFAYLWWLMHTVRIPAPMFEEPLDLSEHLDDLASTGVIFVFALCLIALRFRASKIMHAHLIESESALLRVPRRIIIMASPGILLGALSGLLLLFLQTTG